MLLIIVGFPYSHLRLLCLMEPCPLGELRLPHRPLKLIKDVVRVFHQMIGSSS